jgi:hypothetical protein
VHHHVVFSADDDELVREPRALVIETRGGTLAFQNGLGPLRRDVLFRFFVQRGAKVQDEELVARLPVTALSAKDEQLFPD